MKSVAIALLVMIVFVAGVAQRGAPAPPVRVRQSAPQRTRLVHGPVLFRITPRPTQGQARYEVFFKLNRDPGSTRGGSEQQRVSSGDFSVFRGGRAHAQDVNDIEAINSERDRSSCIAVIFDDVGSTPSLLKRLDRVRLGSHAVRVFLRPYTVTSGGENVLGTTYVASPRMQTSDQVHRSRNAQRALARIGCYRWVGEANV